MQYFELFSKKDKKFIESLQLFSSYFLIAATRFSKKNSHVYILISLTDERIS